MCEATTEALRGLLKAIDTNAKRRVLLTKRPRERRTQSVLLLSELVPQYDRARAALAAADHEQYSAGIS